jgi:sulfite reductase (ferredoxin)
MQSFRTEIENPLVEKDIIELEKKIRLFHEGKIDEQKFRSLRLARGVYGQRQSGVQMVRIKLPQGILNARKLCRIAEVADEYAHGILHFTTRQDIQIHFVNLDRTPQLWAELEKDEITLREACGNTVRNITASPFAGIDSAEPFDVSPYAYSMFEYFLRNPVCQEMGRKIKIAFASSDKDDALTFMHDFGFIPKLQTIDGKQVRGFKVLVGGGLGNQAHEAFTAYEFLAEDQIIPFTEAGLRVFDRYGEREKRMAARLKFLIKQIGAEEYMRLVDLEKKSLIHQSVQIDASKNTGDQYSLAKNEQSLVPITFTEEEAKAFELWKKVNVFPQKQAGFSAIGVKTLIGNIDTKQARELAAIAETLTGDDLRVTITQNLLFRFVPNQNLEHVYLALKKIGLHDAGYETIFDVTSCPGTDTCNLGVASSMGLAKALEDLLKNDFAHLVAERNLSVKISGCMNSCGQHVIANIGFQGMSTPVGKHIAPAFQVLLGGGNSGNGKGRFAEKSLKVFSKRAPEALRALLNDYFTNSTQGELFNDYYDRQGAKYFHAVLTPFGEKSNVLPEEFVDWDKTEAYEKAVGVGECAGVVIDLVQTLLLEADEKLDDAVLALSENRIADAAYHVYSGQINAAKALLTSTSARINTQKSIIDSFDREFTDTGKIVLPKKFADMVLQITNVVPHKTFVQQYLDEARAFIQTLKDYRQVETVA